MGHGGAHSPEMVVLTCFINFYFINSLLQSLPTEDSLQAMNPGYGEADMIPWMTFSGLDPQSNAVKTNQ